MAKIHTMRRRFTVQQEPEEQKFTRHVIGPLKVLAIVIPDENENFITKLFGALPNGNVVLIYDQSGCDMLESGVRIGDTIICANAIFDECENPQYGAYDVIDSVFVLKDQKCIELDGYDPESYSSFDPRTSN